MEVSIHLPLSLSSLTLTLYLSPLLLSSLTLTLYHHSHYHHSLSLSTTTHYHLSLSLTFTTLKDFFERFNLSVGMTCRPNFQVSFNLVIFHQRVRKANCKLFMGKVKYCFSNIFVNHSFLFLAILVCSICFGSRHLQLPACFSFLGVRPWGYSFNFVHSFKIDSSFTI